MPAQTTVEEHKVYLLGPNDTLTELSLQTGTMKSTVNKALTFVGAGKIKVFTEISGVSAPLRLRPGTPQVFVLGTGRAAALPTSLAPGIYASVFKLDVNNKAGTRELLSFSSAGAYLINKTRTGGPVIPLNFSRFGDYAIRIEPRSALAPGEYAFSAGQATTTDPYAPQQNVLYYCFEID